MPNDRNRSASPRARNAIRSPRGRRTKRTARPRGERAPSAPATVAPHHGPHPHAAQRPHLHLPPGSVQQARHPLVSFGLIGGGIFALVAALWMISSSGLITNRFKPDLEQGLSRALNRQVRIERLEGGLFDRAVLRGVRIAAPSQADSLDITIERVVVQYSLWDLLVRKRPLADSLLSIQLIHPLIRFERAPDGHWRAPALTGIPRYGRSAGPAVPGETLPRIRVTLVAGEIRLTNGDETAGLHNLKGLLNLKDPYAARLYLSGKTAHRRLQNVRISGLLNLPENRFRVSVDASRVPLRPFERTARLSDYVEIQDGEADVQLTYATPGSGGTAAGSSGWRGKLVLYDLTASTPLLGQPLRNVFGVANLEDGRLTVKNMQAMLGEIQWTARGAVEDLEHPSLNITVHSENLELKHLARTFPALAPLSFAGEGKAAIRLQGRVPDVPVTATFSMPKGAINGLPIRKFETIFRYQDNELRLLLARGMVSRGWIEGRGKILLGESGPDAAPPKVVFRGEARDIALAEVGRLFGVQPLSGQLSGVLSLSGALADPDLSGSVTVPSLTWAGHRFERVRGRVQLGQDSLALDVRLDADGLPDARLQMDAVRGLDNWILTQARLVHRGRSLLSAEGRWALAGTGPFDGGVRLQRLPLRALPVLPPALAHLDGVLNFTGRVSGRPDQPRVQGQLNTPALLGAGRRAVDAQGEIDATPQRVEIKALRLDRGRIRCSGVANLGERGGVHGTVQFQEALVQDVLRLAGVDRGSIRPEGRLSGEVDLSGSIREIRTKGALTVSSLRWRDLAAQSGTLEFSTTGKRVWIKKFELRQRDRGSFNAVVESDLSQQTGPFRMLVWSERFQYGRRAWTGEAKLTGTFDLAGGRPVYQARLQADNLEINGRALDPIEGEVRVDGPSAVMDRLTWGPTIRARGALAWGEGPLQGNFSATLAQSDLRSVRLLIDPDREPLTEPIDGALNLVLEEGWIRAGLRTGNQERELRVDLAGRLDAKRRLTGWNGEVTLRRLPGPMLFDLFLLATPAHAPQGLFDGTLRLKGDGQALTSLVGDLDLTDVQFGEWRFKTLKTAWTWNPQGLTLTTLEGIQPRGTLRLAAGALTGTVDSGFATDLTLEADQFHFFSRIFSGTYRVTGALRLKPEFDLNLLVRCPNFTLNLYPFGDFRATAHYRGETLSIRTPPEAAVRIDGDLRLPPDGSVEFKRLDIADASRVYVAARGRIDGQGTSDLSVKAQDVPAEIITRSLGWPQPWTGTANGTVRYTDPGHIPHFDIDVKVENGSVLRLPFDLFAGNLRIDHDWLYFDGPAGPAVLRRHGKYTMNLSGRLPLPQSRQAAERMRGAEMDVHLSMPEGDLSYLTFIPYVASASGRSSLDLAVRGTMEYPSLNGQARIRNGTLEPRIYTPKVRDLQADLSFEDNKVLVRALRGEIGDGELRVSAGPAAPWAMIFRRLQPDQLNLKLDTPGQRIRLDTTKDLEWVSALADAHLLLGGTFEAPVLSGTLELSDGQFTYPSRPLTDFARAHQGSAMAYRDFHLRSRRNVWFYNSVVRAQIAPDNSVVFNGGKRDFSGEGRILVNKGSFVYLDTDFTLDPNEEAVVSFSGRDKPRLSALARATIRNVVIKDEGRERDAVIFLRVGGELGALKINLDSEPAMTQAQIVSLLTLGEDYSNWTQQDIDQKIQSAGARILGRWAGNLLGRELGREIKKITPLDVIDIRLGGVEKLADSIMAGSGNTGTASENGASLLKDTQIDVGKYLTDDLFLNYRGILKDRDVEEGGGLSWQSYLGLEYNLGASKRLKIYKNFDADSDQELFWGIEGRTEFQGWSPEQFQESEAGGAPESRTPTSRAP